jgi:hypothetical protein
MLTGRYVQHACLGSQHVSPLQHAFDFFAFFFAAAFVAGFKHCLLRWQHFASFCQQSPFPSAANAIGEHNPTAAKTTAKIDNFFITNLRSCLDYIGVWSDFKRNHDFGHGLAMTLRGCARLVAVLGC